MATRKVDSEGNAIPMLITNRHVVENQSMIILRFTDRTDGSLKEVPASLIENEKPLYKTHPDSNVDIAVLQLNAGFITENNFDFPAFDIDEHAMSSSDLRSKGVDEGSLVYMLGYPMGLVNVSSKLPICRLGCVARMSEAQIHETKNIQEKKAQQTFCFCQPILQVVRHIRLTADILQKADTVGQCSLSERRKAERYTDFPFRHSKARCAGNGKREKCRPQPFRKILEMRLL